MALPGGEGRAGTKGIFVSKFIKRIAKLLSLLSWLKVLRRRPTKDKIVFFSQSQKLHSQIVSKSDCSLCVPAFLPVIFLRLPRTFEQIFVCLLAVNVASFSQADKDHVA
jgi:hypothetical protein